MHWMRSIACFPIRVYQWTLSPLKQALLGPGSGCRFKPTCSSYAIEAIQRHGILKGILLGSKRLFRCHPWGGHGWDPVPPGREAPPPDKNHEAKMDRPIKRTDGNESRQPLTHAMS